MSHYPLEEQPADPKPAAERAFGRYRLAYQLASGGMGTVYLARAAGPGGFEKLVALKRIHPHMANDDRFISMFLDEARIAARIQHPNVCSVIDFGEVDGSYFLTMPFILGASMNRVIAAAAKLKDGPLYDALPWMAARMVADSCEGLHAAHELLDDGGRPLDVVHRDVSPHNLMVGYDGAVRVLDFGVASARSRHHQTATGEVKGKFAYLAPEQIEAQPIDRRADVWALGVVLWEAVAARRLFARENMAATIRAVCDMSIPSIRTVRSDAPEGLDAIVEKALCRDPGGRYASARAMGRDLQQLLARSERFVAAPELAEWMEQLLPQERRTQEQLVEATRTGKLEELPATPPPPLLDRSSVHRRGDSPSGSRPVDAETSTDLRPAGRRSRVPIFAAVGVLALGAASMIAGGFALATRSERGEIRSVPLPPSPPVVDPSPERAVPTAPEPTAPEPTAPEPTAPEPTAPEPIAPEPVSPEAPSPTVSRSVPAHDARRRGEGTLTVATPGGWAFVFLGRRQLGEAPGVFTLPAGRQTIGIQPFGRGVPIQRRVTIPEDGTARVSVPIGP